jgi:beta-mannosidase
MLTQLSLHGEWLCAKCQDPSDSWIAMVPGCVHADLLRHGRIPDPFWGRNESGVRWIEETDFIFTRTFQSTDSLARCPKVELVLEGVDTLCEVRLNGVTVGRTETMFGSYRFDVRSSLREGSNEMALIFSNPTDYIRARLKPDHVPEMNDPVGGSSLIRKEQCSFGWDWGPRLASCGVYRPIYLEGWHSARLGELIVETDPQGDLHVRACGTESKPENLRLTLTRNGTMIGQTSGAHLKVDGPDLWWPNGHGAPNLYDLTVNLIEDQTIIDQASARVGFRAIELLTDDDAWGQSFQFVVNGRKIFAKGTNWIPAHTFLNEVSDEMYRHLLGSARDCHMNMIRVWGGGVFETDQFYNLCDEFGLLVWQDFMFACAMYPLAGYKDLYDREITTQVRRLSRHPSLALWNGNNEVGWTPNATARQRRDYRQLFGKFIPAVIERELKLLKNPAPYWPASPHKPHKYLGSREKDSGDTHDWAVWHGGEPVSWYQQTRHRFVSEFGMQSYPSVEVARAFTHDVNPFSPDFEHHQKSPAGNERVLQYLAHYFPYPLGLESLSYLSQITQAEVVRAGVDHWRSLSPRCAGALYWQLNDCWPAISWSSIDFGGHWRALQHAARRFFAPIRVIGKLDGSVKAGKQNWLTNEARALQLTISSDLPEPLEIVLEVDLFDVRQATPLRTWRQKKICQPLAATHFDQLDVQPLVNRPDWEHLLLRLTACLQEEIVSEESVLLGLPKLADWQRPGIQSQLQEDPDATTITLHSDLVAYKVALPETMRPWSNNYFDLYPDRPVRVSLATNLATAESRRKVKIVSLYDFLGKKPED